MFFFTEPIFSDCERKYMATINFLRMAWNIDKNYINRQDTIKQMKNH